MTVGEAVERLMEILSGEEKLMISMMSEDELIDLRFGLGLAVRNAFGLHEPGSKLLSSCGTSHPDDASNVIIKSLWRNLSAL
ncbi:DUF6794 domain-containing protein [Methylotuvimicrobium buryatense]|uniref:DUF6794 domain-containing protein n=1 Tax=Methylotuvimicrobium buryatense TaxID=95641 RepID=UPI00034963EB|nr:DUF6794 domain-containing protein [Methylotuvimicrobium buryatense]